MTNADVVDQLRQALGKVEELVAGIHDDMWVAATPCTEWTVRDLVNHLVGGNLLTAGLASAQTPPSPDRVSAPRGADHLGNDPLGAYRRSATALLDAFGAPGRLEAPIDMPIGTLPGTAAVHLRITETLVHGWDLARATGQDLAVPEELADQALGFTAALLPRLPAGRSPFAEAKPVPSDAPAIDRLAATLGRRVDRPEGSTK